MQKFRTAKIAADRLMEYQYAVTADMGITGVVGLLKNEEITAVMLGANMDTLPFLPNQILHRANAVRESDTVRYRSGAILSVANSLKLYSLSLAPKIRPETSIDQVAMAAPIIMRLQTIIFREGAQ